MVPAPENPMFMWALAHTAHTYLQFKIRPNKQNTVKWKPREEDTRHQGLGPLCACAHSQNNGLMCTLANTTPKGNRSDEHI